MAGNGTTYGYSSNRLVSASGGESGSYAYDGAGRVTSGTWGSQSYSLTYDNFNNVAAFLSGANVLVDNGYDGDGLRATKAAGGRTTVYHYDQGGNVLSENYTNGKWIADYVHLNGKLIAKATAVMDYDSDGMPDSWEETYGLDSNSAANAASDADADGLNNLQEYQKGTNPIVGDTDGDGGVDGTDAFPLNPSEWLDTDGDGIGNNTDTDDDGDGLPDTWETSFGLNPVDSADAGLDGDGDGLTNLQEYQKGTNPTLNDTDGDERLDGVDAFPLDPSEQFDTDLDGIGNNADADDDNDAIPDAWETTYGMNSLAATDAALDSDSDGLTNLQEYQKGTNPTFSDTDGDGAFDGADAFPLNPAEWLDTDGDGQGNNVDNDDDNDGVPDLDDVFPLDPTESADADGDGIGDNADTDDDNDGVLDVDDAFALDPAEWADADADGIGNNADTDDDNDGMPDDWETSYGLNPLDAGDAALDSDGDGWTNLEEYQLGADPTVGDGDNDGMLDNWEVANDLNPADPGDADLDYDNDGMSNRQEFRLRSNPWNADSDGDGIVDGVEYFGVLVPIINLFL